MVQSTYIDTMCVVMYPSPIGVMWCQFVMDNPISHQTMLIELFLTECRHFLLIMCTQASHILNSHGVSFNGV